MKFDLLNELKNYKPYNETEKKKVEKFIEFLETKDNLYSRTNLEGHVTAGGFIVDKNCKILINRHKNSIHWLQFGGHSDGNANSLEVAIREINEESGIFDLKLISNKILDVDIHVVPNNEKRNEPEHLHYDVNFLFFSNDHDFKISDESDEIRWVDINEAKVLLGKTSESKVRMIAKIEQMFLSNHEIFKS